MGKGFFDISSSKQMYEKARREYKKLMSDFSPDNMFNFFVTAYHIGDYLRLEDNPKKAAFDSLPSIASCRTVCNMAKHFEIDIQSRANRGKYKETPEAVKYSGVFGGAPLGQMILSGGDQYVVYIDQLAVDLENLAYHTMAELDSLFN